MGLNLVIVCHPHRVRRWIYRGHEGDGIVTFYHEHWSCTSSDPHAIELSDDQSSLDWVNDEDRYREERFPEDDDG